MPRTQNLLRSQRALGIRGHVGLVLFAAAFTVAAGLLLASPALADAALESSNPADGARITEMPEAASLTFNQGVLAQGAAASLEGADGRIKKLADVTVRGRTAAFALPSRATSGKQVLRWRVVSTDGHPISGTVGFTLTANSPPSTTAATPTPSRTPDPDPTSTSGDDSQATGVLIGGAIGAALGTVWVIVDWQRRRRREP